MYQTYVKVTEVVQGIVKSDEKGKSLTKNIYLTNNQFNFQGQLI